MSKKDYTPHEGLFNKIFSDPDNTRYFLKQHLSEGIQRYINLNSLYLENTTYLDDELRKHFADLVFSVMLEGEEFPTAKVYLLFEHKGAPDSLVGMQILRYMALQWKDLYDQGKIVGGKLPPILPIVIYQGQDTWKTSTSFQDLVDMPSDSFKAYIPDFVFAFFNVKGLDKQKVQENVLLKFYVELINILNTPEIKDFPLRLARGLLESMESRTALEYIEIFFKYLTKATDTVKKEDYQKALDLIPEGGKDIMNTLADQWMQEGEQKGEQRGIVLGEIKKSQEMLIKSLKMRFNLVKPNISEKIQSINSKDVLDNLFELSFKCATMEEFTQYLDEVIDS